MKIYFGRAVGVSQTLGNTRVRLCAVQTPARNQGVLTGEVFPMNVRFLVEVSHKCTWGQKTSAFEHLGGKNACMNAPCSNGSRGDMEIALRPEELRKNAWLRDDGKQVRLYH